jgi:transmembrane sensor
MKLKNSSNRRNKIIDEAAEWFVLMQQEHPRPSDVREFADWLASSAEHVREYLQVSVLSRDFARLPDNGSVAALIRAGRDENPGNVIPLGATDSRRPQRRTGFGRRRSGWRRPVLAALAVAVVSLPFLEPWAPSSETYETGVGEQLSFPLEDGTVMTLNTRSKVRLAFTGDHRDVLLMTGEALFDVTKDPQRPFRVLTGKAMISAVGTSFNVRHRRDSTVVTVVEGSIEVATRAQGAGRMREQRNGRENGDGQLSPVLVTIGQQARVEGSSGRVAVIETSVAKATAWRERRLVFDSKPLSAVAEEFNLYNDGTILIGDSVLNSLAISGAFSANDRHSFALFLEETGLADVEFGPDDTITLVAPGEASE